MSSVPAGEVEPAGTPGPRIGLALPGGFEFGGIGRVMLYATRAWALLPGGPDWRLIDARGAGPPWLMPLHLGRAMVSLVAGRLAGTGCDLLHLNLAGRASTWRKILLGELASLLDLPYLVHLHDYDYAADFRARGPLGRWLAGRLFRRAARVLVLGQRDHATATGLLGVPDLRIAIVPNGVPDPGPPPTRSGREGPIRILFLGHLDDRKGVPELLTALAAPALRRRDWHLTMAGGGELARISALLHDLGLAERVTLTGWLPHERTYELCRAADLFVLPSHAEGQAMSLLEAMAHGLAIVTTPVGAHPETIADGAEGLLVRPGDPGMLAGALAALIDDPALRGRLGAAARARYLAHFTARHMAARLARLYRNILAEAASVPTPLAAELDRSGR